MCKDDNRVNQAIKIIFDATWSLLIVGQSNSLYETYFCSISSFPPWQPALLQAEHDPRLRSLRSGSRLSRLWMCLWWRRHDDGRWSRGDIYDVIVHRVSLLTKSSTSIAFIFIPSQCPAHLETWRWAHVHLSPNVERPIKHYTLIVHIIHKREVLNHLRYSHHKISIPLQALLADAVKSMSLHSSLLAFSGLACACFVTDLAFTSTSNELMNLLLAMRREVSNSRPRTTEFISYCEWCVRIR